MIVSKYFNSGLLLLALVSFVAQLVIDFSSINIATSCIIFTSVVSTLFYFRWSKALETHPLSSFAIFGFCITSLFGALVAQSASWLAVSANLYQPITTFSLLAMYQVIAIVAHSLYQIMTSSSTASTGLVRNFFQFLGIYTMPSVQVLWVMGGMGAFFLLLSKFSAIANGFSFLAWTPFLIPIYSNQVGQLYCNIKKNYFFLTAYTALIAMIAMIFNARGMLLTGGATVALLFILFLIRSNKQVTASVLLKFGAFIMFATVLSWPASNLVTAMAVTRADRGKVSASEMITRTIENFQSPESLEKYERFVEAQKLRSSYDETYITNPIVARLVTTKFHDNAIYFASKVSEKGSEEIMQVTGDFLWAGLPQPWLDAIKVDVDKDKMHFSMGDMMAHYAIGTPLSGLRTGSVFGHGWVLFGIFFPVIYFFMCFILFMAIDVFSTRTAKGVTVLSVIGMLNIWPNFLFGITADSLQHLINGILRGVVQSVLIYSIAFAIAKLIAKFFLKILNDKPALSFSYDSEMK